jgi:hypothetical protein
MPLIIEWTYKDGTKEIDRIPAQIWRKKRKHHNQSICQRQRSRKYSIGSFLRKLPTLTNPTTDGTPYPNLRNLRHSNKN